MNHDTVDVLVNNAFRSHAFDLEQRQPFDALSWADDQAQFDGSVGAAFHVCRAALPQLRRRAQGSIASGFVTGQVLLVDGGMVMR